MERDENGDSRFGAFAAFPMAIPLSVAFWLVIAWLLIGSAWAIHTTSQGTGTLPPPAAPFTSPTFNLDAATVEAVLLRQPAPVLKWWYERALPRPCALVAGGPVATVGLITAGPGPSVLPVQIGGCVVESATKVQVRVNDLMPYYDVTPVMTQIGHAKSWVWPIPVVLQDGRTHKVYARALRASGTVIGPLDNAKAATQWPFKIGSGGGAVPIPTGENPTLKFIKP